MNEHLYRSRDDRVISGVAGGLAERLDMDPSLVRILWLLLVPLTGGFALLVYIVMAIVVPDQDSAWSPYTSSPPWTGNPPPWTGNPPPADASDVPATATAGPAATPTSPISPISPPSWASTGTAAGPGFVPQPMDRHAWREQRRAERALRRAGRRNGSGGYIAGAVLIVIGALFLLQEYVPAFDPGRFWPLLLIGIGIVLFVAAFGRHDSGPGQGIQ